MGASHSGPSRTEEANHNHNKTLLNKTMVTTTRKYLNKFQKWKKLANHKGGTTNSKANAKGERARKIITKAKAISAAKVIFEKSSVNGAYTNPTAILGIKWPTG